LVGSVSENEAALPGPLLVRPKSVPGSLCVAEKGSVSPPPPPPPAAEMVSVFPEGVMVTFAPAASVTLSVSPLSVLTT
jgi:hypothetical protein